MSYQEFRPSSFNIMPPVTKYLLGINVVLFLLKFLAKGLPLDLYLDLFYAKSQYFKPYQFITHMFMHASFTHLIFNMVALFSFGSILERLWGSKRFFNFYFLCGLGSAAAQFGSFYYTDYQLQMAYPGADLQSLYDSMACLGASGAVFGLLGAFGLLFPNTLLSLFFFIPIKAKYAVILFGLIELTLGSSLVRIPGDNIAHFAHLGGLAVGLIIVLFWRKSRNNFY